MNWSSRGKLMEWADAKQAEDWRGILLGNGASLAVWEGFAYQSLFEVARTRNQTAPLIPADQELFQKFGTRDFESVLSALRTAQMVNECLPPVAPQIRERYRSIRLALLEAIKGTHIPWSALFGGPILHLIRKELAGYEFVYTTNYDLLVYWAVMAAGGQPEDFKDYFWTKQDDCWLAFDPLNTVAMSNCTKVLYLHGGLHIYECAWGDSLKRVAGTEGNLLDLFLDPWDAEAHPEYIPLFVTEGSARDKLRAIGQSDYLSFAYRHLSNFSRPMVVFGHSLGPADAHLTQAIRSWDGARIAIAIRAGATDKLREMMAAYQAALPNARLLFFDAGSHPLGSSELQVDRDAETVMAHC